jgi:hypothetical protein
MPFAVAMAATSATSALLSGRLGVRWTLVLGLSLAVLGLLSLSTTEVDTAFWQIALGTGVIGLGMGMMMAPASLQISGSVPAQYSSMAGALNSVIRELGGVLGIAVLGTVVSSAYRGDPGLVLPGADLPAAHAAAAAMPPADAQRVLSAADAAFTSAMDRSALVAAGIAFVMAVAVACIRPAPARTTTPAEAELVAQPA